MKRMLINATQTDILRVAIMDGQQLYNLSIEDSSKVPKKSNIYKGKITRVEPSLEAVFVDYGSRKNGFLPFKEISRNYFSESFLNSSNPSVQDILQKGKECIVQINKEERGKKGASLTTFISLPGNYLVLMPNSPKVGGISRKIEGKDRIYLKKILSMLIIPENMGLIIRTSGLGKSIKTLQSDLNFHLKNWYKIKKSAEIHSAPYLIHKESNVIIRMLRDYLQLDIQEIIVDNPKMLDLVYQYVSQLEKTNFNKNVRLYTGSNRLFNHYKIESQINSIFQRIVKLPSGGSIILDNTEALTAIDINSASSTRGVDIEETAFNTNTEAVYEIARQLRLRDLGGLIVIDFIDMNSLQHQKTIEYYLYQALRQDRARIQIGSISQFGLLELSRQRLGSLLRNTKNYICSKCNNTKIIKNNISLLLSIFEMIKKNFLLINILRIDSFISIKTIIYFLNKIYMVLMFNKKYVILKRFLIKY